LVAAVVAGTLLWSARDRGTSIDAYRFVPIAVDAGVQSMPAWSPDGQSLAFSGEVDGYYQIFTRRLDQSTAVQVTRLPGDCLYPAWDAGGTRIFFQVAQTTGQSFLGYSTEVWMVGAAGGAPERLIAGATAFTVAPDGRSLVFLAGSPASAGKGAFVLRAFDLQDRSTRELIPVPFKWDGTYYPTSRDLKFSPDGAALALLKPAGDELLVLPNPLAAPGGASRTVRFGPTAGGVVSLYEFDWMPDSRHVVFVLRDPMGGDQSLWMGDVNRGTLGRITASSQWESTPAASPEGGRIAYSSTPLDWDIIEIDLASRVSRPLIASARYDGWGDWRPDGSGLVFSTQRTGRFEIWEQSFRDGVARMVVTPDAFQGEPSLFLVQGAISPDGRSLAYVRFAPSGTRVYLTALGGSRPVRLTSEAATSESDDGPMWSPDGRWIIFRRGHQLMKALAIGGTAPLVVTDDIVDASTKSEGAAQWLPDGRAVVYSAADGLKQLAVDGGTPRLISRERPMVWDVSPHGRLIYAILERDARMMDLVTIEIATGALHTLQSLGRRPLTPDQSGYWDTVRALRVSPDGKRLMYARLNPTADIWILEGVGGRTSPAR
jgi:Tol biopolymer transport system component